MNALLLFPSLKLIIFLNNASLSNNYDYWEMVIDKIFDCAGGQKIIQYSRNKLILIWLISQIKYIPHFNKNLSFSLQIFQIENLFYTSFSFKLNFKNRLIII